MAHYFLHVASIVKNLCGKTCWMTLSNIVYFGIVLIAGWLLMFVSSETVEYLLVCDFESNDNTRCRENRMVYFTCLIELFFWLVEYCTSDFRVVCDMEDTEIISCIFTRDELQRMRKSTLMKMCKGLDLNMGNEQKKDEFVDAILQYQK